ncbi:MAG TPA: hypothetical protein EYP64_00460 [Desulfarculaceae bacterium]|nr:hypothetical protein [Desulfarculaceae bacterium]
MKFANKNIQTAFDMLENEVMDYVKSQGGEALQAQIQNDLGFVDINCNCNPNGNFTRGWFAGAILASLLEKELLERVNVTPRIIRWKIVD